MSRLFTYSTLVVSTVVVLSGASFAKNDAQNRLVRTSEWSDGAGGFALESAYQPGLSHRGFRRSSTRSFSPRTTLTAVRRVSTGRTSVDMTLQTGDYWHVDDFCTNQCVGESGGKNRHREGTTLRPSKAAIDVDGTAHPAGRPRGPDHCHYAALPGYGNSWYQSFCSKACLVTSAAPPPISTSRSN
jgi:hypothetical protein